MPFAFQTNLSENSDLTSCNPQIDSRVAQASRPMLAALGPRAGLPRFFGRAMQNRMMQPIDIRKHKLIFDEKYSLCLFFDSQPAKGGKAKGGKYGAGKFTKRAPSTRSARAGLQVSSQVRFCNVLVYWSVMGHFDSEKVLFMISSDLYSFEIRKSLFIIWDYRLRSPQTVFW